MASDIERAAFSRGVRSRDAEIAALKAEVERLRAAFAAGPAALRQFGDAEMTATTARVHVEAAQAAAMKEKP